MSKKIQHFYDKETATFTYVVSDDASGKCAVIDSVMAYDLSSGKISYDLANLVIDYIRKNNLSLEWILETHIHADHLTAASYIKEKLGGKIAVGEGIKEVLKYWVKVFDSYKDTPLDASQFDHVFVDGEEFLVGSLKFKVINTPGHTPACVSYLLEDVVFVGDMILSPQIGTARTDFRGGDARILYHSIHKIFSLPKETKIYIGHDYPAKDKDAEFVFSVASQREKNILINDSVGEEEYVRVRNERDFGKSVPKLLFPAIQVNIRAGRFGEKDGNGEFYIKTPVSFCDK